MLKDADVKLTCRQCGREFVFTKAEQDFYEQKGFTLPGRCQECRSNRQNQTHQVVCSHCGTELEKGAAIYCTACLASAHLESGIKTRQSQQAASAAHTKLQASESQKAELEELLRQKEQLLAEMEMKVNTLNQDLEKAHQFYAALGSLRPILDDIEKKLGALEHVQDKTNERMLQIAQRMHELYENTGLLEVIKRSLRPHSSQDTQPT